MPTHSIRNLNAVSQTLLIPLYFRAMESQRSDALVRDPKAVELADQLHCDFSGVQRMKKEQANFLLRMREFDRLARAFLAEHPAVRQRDLARMRPVTAAHQPGVTDGVVRGAERPVLDQRCIRWKLVRHRVDAGDVQGLVDGHARQDTAAACCGMARASKVLPAPAGPIISTFGPKDSCF